MTSVSVSAYLKASCNISNVLGDHIVKGDFHGAVKKLIDGLGICEEYDSEMGNLAVNCASSLSRLSRIVAFSLSPNRSETLALSTRSYAQKQRVIQTFSPDRKITVETHGFIYRSDILMDKRWDEYPDKFKAAFALSAI